MGEQATHTQTPAAHCFAHPKQKVEKTTELIHTCNTTKLLEHIHFGTALHFILDRPGCRCTPHRLFCTNTLMPTSFAYTAPLPYMTTTHIDASWRSLFYCWEKKKRKITTREHSHTVALIFTALHDGIQIFLETRTLTSTSGQFWARTDWVVNEVWRSPVALSHRGSDLPQAYRQVDFSALVNTKHFSFSSNPKVPLTTLVPGNTLKVECTLEQRSCSRGKRCKERDKLMFACWKEGQPTTKNQKLYS